MATPIGRINFTDGTYLNITMFKDNYIPGDTAEDKLYHSVVSTRSCAYARTKDGIIYDLVKTDLDGGRWGVVTSGIHKGKYQLGNLGYLVTSSPAGSVSVMYLSYSYEKDLYYASVAGSLENSFINGYNAKGDSWGSQLSAKRVMVGTFTNTKLPFNTIFWLPAGKGGHLLGNIFSPDDMKTKLPQSGEEYTPNEDGGTSHPDGGDGWFDGSSDDIPFPDLPSISASDAGFVTIYSPSVPQLNQLASYMWTGDFVDKVKKLFGDPMDAILGLSIVPVSPQIRDSVEVKVGYISTGVFMNKVGSQYVTVDCGSLEIKEYWGNALDYSPYTKMQLYLPYIGTRELNVDEIMGKTLRIRYVVDVLSGSVSAQVSANSSVLYQFSGSCMSAIPVSGRDFADVISGTLSIASTVGAVVATAGMSAPISAVMATSGVMSTVGNVTSMKPRIEHSGSMSSTAGLLGIQKPYIIAELPRQSLPVGYKRFEGYPSNISGQLKTLTGYTRIQSIHLENIPCTITELEEIDMLLKEGVII